MELPEVHGKVCRTCLKETTKLIPLDVKFEEHPKARKMLEFLHGSDILDCEAFSNICELCIATLVICYTFKQQCLASEEKIRDYIEIAGPFACGNPVVFFFKEENSEGWNMQENRQAEEQKAPQPDATTDAVLAQETPVKDEEEDMLARPMHCLRCRVTFPSNLAYSLHCSQYHLQGKHRKVQLQPKGSIENVENTKYINCSQCNITFLSIPTYRKHYWSEHLKRQPTKSSKALCEFCGKYILRRNISVHHRSHHRRTSLYSNYSSDVAAATEVSQTDYCAELNIKLHKEQLPHECSYCHKRFLTGAAMRMHKEAHMRENGLCTICGKDFGIKKELVRHMLIRHRKKLT